jgi:hypothetical protein
MQLDARTKKPIVLMCSTPRFTSVYPVGTRGSFAGIKWPEREALHSPPSSAVVKECVELYEGVSKSFRTGRLERELKTVQLSATRWNCIAFLWVSLLSFAAITLYVAIQREFIVVVYFIIVSVRKLLDTLSYLHSPVRLHSVVLS